MFFSFLQTAYAQGAEEVVQTIQVPPVVTDAANQAIVHTQTAMTSIDWSNPSWDLFIILFFVVAALLYGMSLGRDRIVTILVSIYMSLAVMNYAPFIRNPIETNFGIENLFVIKISSFIGIFVILFFIISRSALLNTIVGSNEQKGAWWQVMIFSILHVGLLIAIVLSFLPKESINSLAPFTKQVFTGDTALFWWIMGPILAMVFTKKKAGGGEE
jgi:hypothetical protein